MIKVSILIPAYNQPELLRRTLDSVFNQSYENYEVIVTDDTPDNDLIKQVIQNYNGKVKYFHNKYPLGSPENWNSAITKAKGEYIKFIHHDDYLTDYDSLKKFVVLLDENPNSDFGFSATEIRGIDRSFVRFNRPTNDQVNQIEVNPFYIYPENIIGAPSATIYRKKVSKFFDKRLKWVVDIDFYLQILYENNHLSYTDQALICTTTGGEHQITAECAHNSQVEFFEWSYLYHKILKNYPGIDREDLDRNYRKLLKKLIKKHKIISLRKLTEIINGDLTMQIKFLLIPNLARTIIKK